MKQPDSSDQQLPSLGSFQHSSQFSAFHDNISNSSTQSATDASLHSRTSLFLSNGNSSETLHSSPPPIRKKYPHPQPVIYTDTGPLIVSTMPKSVQSFYYALPFSVHPPHHRLVVPFVNKNSTLSDSTGTSYLDTLLNSPSMSDVTHNIEGRSASGSPIDVSSKSISSFQPRDNETVYSTIENGSFDHGKESPLQHPSLSDVTMHGAYSTIADNSNTNPGNDTLNNSTDHSQSFKSLTSDSLNRTAHSGATLFSTANVSQTTTGPLLKVVQVSEYTTTRIPSFIDLEIPSTQPQVTIQTPDTSLKQRSVDNSRVSYFKRNGELSNVMTKFLATDSSTRFNNKHSRVSTTTEITSSYHSDIIPDLSYDEYLHGINIVTRQVETPIIPSLKINKQSLPYNHYNDEHRTTTEPIGTYNNHSNITTAPVIDITVPNISGITVPNVSGADLVAEVHHGSGTLSHGTVHSAQKHNLSLTTMSPDLSDTDTHLALSELPAIDEHELEGSVAYQDSSLHKPAADMEPTLPSDVQTNTSSISASYSAEPESPSTADQVSPSTADQVSPSTAGQVQLDNNSRALFNISREHTSANSNAEVYKHLPVIDVVLDASGVKITTVYNNYDDDTNLTDIIGAIDTKMHNYGNNFNESLDNNIGFVDFTTVTSVSSKEEFVFEIPFDSSTSFPDSNRDFNLSVNSENVTNPLIEEDAVQTYSNKTNFNFNPLKSGSAIVVSRGNISSTNIDNTPVANHNLDNLKNISSISKKIKLHNETAPLLITDQYIQNISNHPTLPYQIVSTHPTEPREYLSRQDASYPPVNNVSAGSIPYVRNQTTSIDSNDNSLGNYSVDGFGPSYYNSTGTFSSSFGYNTYLNDSNFNASFALGSEFSSKSSDVSSESGYNNLESENSNLLSVGIIGIISTSLIVGLLLLALVSLVLYRRYSNKSSKVYVDRSHHPVSQSYAEVSNSNSPDLPFELQELSKLYDSCSHMQRSYLTKPMPPAILPQENKFSLNYAIDPAQNCVSPHQQSLVALNNCYTSDNVKVLYCEQFDNRPAAIVSERKPTKLKKKRAKKLINADRINVAQNISNSQNEPSASNVGKSNLVNSRNSKGNRKLVSGSECVSNRNRATNENKVSVKDFSSAAVIVSHHHNPLTESLQIALPTPPYSRKGSVSTTLSDLGGSYQNLDSEQDSCNSFRSNQLHVQAEVHVDSGTSDGSINVASPNSVTVEQMDISSSCDEVRLGQSENCSLHSDIVEPPTKFKNKQTVVNLSPNINMGRTSHQNGIISPIDNINNVKSNTSDMNDCKLNTSNIIDTKLNLNINNSKSNLSKPLYGTSILKTSSKLSTPLATHGNAITLGASRPIVYSSKGHEISFPSSALLPRVSPPTFGASYA